MTKQEMFDTAMAGLAAQGEKSMDEHGYCRYRATKDGGGTLKCGIGFCIPDEMYRSDFDADKGILPHQIRDISPGLASLWAGIGEIFMRSLQLIHDKNPPAYWRDEGRAFAMYYKLSTENFDKLEWKVEQVEY